jgi:hypothetical protein
LTVPAGSNETVLAQQGEMLRDAGIADGEELGQFANGSFAFDELGKG